MKMNNYAKTTTFFNYDIKVVRNSFKISEKDNITTIIRRYKELNI